MQLIGNYLWIITSKEGGKYVFMSVHVGKQVKIRLALNELQLDSALVVWWLLQLIESQSLRETSVAQMNLWTSDLRQVLFWQ